MKYKLAYAVNVYSKQLEAIEILIECAEINGFPVEHIHRLKHLKAEIEGLISLGDCESLFPNAKVGRRPVEAPSYQDLAQHYFLSVTPAFKPYKRPAKQPALAPDLAPVIEELSTVVFDFNKK